MSGFVFAVNLRMKETLKMRRGTEQFWIELSSYPEGLIEIEDFVKAARDLRNEVHGIILAHDAGTDISGALKRCSLLVSQLEISTEFSEAFR